MGFPSCASEKPGGELPSSQASVGWSVEQEHSVFPLQPMAGVMQSELAKPLIGAEASVFLNALVSLSCELLASVRV